MTSQNIDYIERDPKRINRFVKVTTSYGLLKANQLKRSKTFLFYYKKVLFQEVLAEPDASAHSIRW
jgi:hypothetical protein